MTTKNIEVLTHVYIDPETVKEMSEADEHTKLIQYLTPLLEWLYRDRNWYILSNIKMIRRDSGIRQDIAPDIAIVKNITLPITPPNTTLSSWRIGQPNRPAPSVVFEVASKATWRNDIDQKINEYRLLGVSEYFAYDPYTPALWAINGVRLRGWQYRGGQAQELTLDARGWMRSEELDAWLVPDSKFLRLHNNRGRRYLSQAEEERRAKLQERRAGLQELRAAERRLDRERQAAQARLLAERQTAERQLAAERQTAERQLAAERLARQEAERRLAELEAKLRELNNNL